MTKRPEPAYFERVRALSKIRVPPKFAQEDVQQGAFLYAMETGCNVECLSCECDLCEMEIEDAARKAVERGRYACDGKERRYLYKHGLRKMNIASIAAEIFETSSDDHWERVAEKAKRVEFACSTLTPEERVVIEQKKLGCPQSEIAEMLGVAPQRIVDLKNRAYRKIRKALDGCDPQQG